MTKAEEILAMDGPLNPETCAWWEHFLANHSTVDELFASDLHPLQRHKELDWMLALARKRTACSVVLDVGSDKGGSTWVFAKELHPRKLVSVEIRGVPWAPLLQESLRGVSLLALEGSSYDGALVAEVRRFLGKDRIDVAFLDGDKCFLDFDFDMYHPMLARPSVVFFHDITDDAPRGCFERVKKKYEYPSVEFVNTDESTLAVRREKWGLPPSCSHEAWLRHWGGQSCGVGAVVLE